MLPTITEAPSVGDVSSGCAKPQQADARAICRKSASSVGHAAGALHDEERPAFRRRQLIIVAAAATTFSAGLYMAIRGLRLRRAEDAQLRQLCALTGDVALLKT